MTGALTAGLVADAVWRRHSMGELLLGALVGGVGGVVVATLAGHRHAAERELLRSVETDSLTGMLNRQSLVMRAAELDLEDGYVVMLVDLDRFKAVNDTYGHRAGDEVLVEIAHRFQAVADELSVPLTGRLGGDEFVFLLLQADQARASTLSRMLRDALEPPVTVSGRPLRVRASVGYAIGHAGQTFDDLLLESDIAVHQAKESGRDRVVEFGARLRRDILKALPQALDSGEIVCRFQPQIDIDTGEVVGLEALARWVTDDGVIPAGDLIDTLEWLGETHRLLEAVVEAVARAAHDLDALYQGRFWINLSAADIGPADAADRLLEVLVRSGMAPHRVGIEVTESLPILDLAHARRVLGSLRSAGYGVAVDDFGTANTPLLYLTALPVDLVKLDRSLVEDLDGRPENMAMLRAMREVSRSLGLEVVVEGVETRRQVEVLRELGLRVAQGYVFARPMAPTDLHRYLRERQAGSTGATSSNQLAR
ncbi:MAG: EAL domain-containing protein [Actinomycetia bacterium]|nr:EAL domain-containing protein [Actinomycetes bacterium]